MPSSTRHRVLCVDDDEDSRVMLVNLLRLAFIEAKAVGTAAQAFSLIQAEHFDLYMLDVWLPDIDGFELCRRMRALDAYTPILFFSGAAYEADKKKGIEVGADAYVTKPDINGLLESIKQFTSQVAEHTVARKSPWAEVLPAPGERMHIRSVENSASRPCELTHGLGFQFSCQPEEIAKHPDATA
jgi:DNA-binding response OmpR family regulator